MKLLENEEKTFIVNDVCSAIISDKGTVLPLETIIKRLNLRPATNTIYCGDKYLRGPCEKLNELSEEDKKFYEDFDSCPGHPKIHQHVEFPFDGWTLAFYVQKWHEQVPSGNAPVFERDGDIPNY